MIYYQVMQGIIVKTNLICLLHSRGEEAIDEYLNIKTVTIALPTA